MMWRKYSLIAIVFLVLIGIVGFGTAQDDTTTPLPDMRIIPLEPIQQSDEPINFEPSRMTAGTAQTLTVRVPNASTLTFANTYRVRLRGYGILPTTFVNERVLTAEVPAIVPANFYSIEVLDGNGVRVARSSNQLEIAAAPTARPTLNPEPPTPIPGEPSLVARNFSVSPQTIAPGETVTLTFEVVNQGNRPALGVSAAVNASGGFVPAIGQASAVLPDIYPGASAFVSLSAVATREATAGAASIPVTISYRDFTGESYTTETALSVNIRAVTEAAQVILARYQYDPNPVRPGENVTVTALITNTGTQTASQVLLRVSGEGVLLAGAQGDSFPLGELAPGASVGVELPMVVNRSAEAGPQSQPFTISYLQEGETQQVEGSMTLDVARVLESRPLMLLDSYDLDRDPLEPGMRFILSATVKNAGETNAMGAMVTFGTVESSGGGNPGGGGNENGTNTSTTPSTTFAPLGTGGTLFIGEIGAGMTTTFSQEFIVNGTTDTGIYSLPITLRYQTEDGEAVQENLRASVIVIEPPALTLAEQSPVPEMVNVGEPFFIGFEIENTGTGNITLTTATTRADNGEVIEGVETALGVVGGDDSTTYSAAVMPLEEGAVSVTVTIRYLDGLNTEREIVRTYETNAVMPPPPIDDFPPIDVPVTPEPETPESGDWLGQLLLGLLGLGR